MAYFGAIYVKFNKLLPCNLLNFRCAKDNLCTRVPPIDRPKLLTYLRLCDLHPGLVINFHAEILKDGSIKAKVSPEKLPLNNPLAGVGEAINALTYFTDELGQVTIVGPGAGRRETGFSLLIDLLEINRKSI